MLAPDDSAIIFIGWSPREDFDGIFLSVDEMKVLVESNIDLEMHTYLE